MININESKFSSDLCQKTILPDCVKYYWGSESTTSGYKTVISLKNNN